MSKVDDGGPAFPAGNNAHDAMEMNGAGMAGMTLRDYFAAKAMYGLIGDSKLRNEVANTSDHDSGSWHVEFAEMAYSFADAMLAARKAQQ